MNVLLIALVFTLPELPGSVKESPFSLKWQRKIGDTVHSAAWEEYELYIIFPYVILKPNDQLTSVGECHLGGTRHARKNLTHAWKT